jgi:prepilin-type N-terminal cleavage/methylation domain-containing protein
MTQTDRYYRCAAFTLIELLVGMMITSIILTAVATLAFAMSVASTVSGDTAAKQMQIRQATLRLVELVGSCKLLCAAPGNDLVLWRADDTPANNRINVNEVVYIERGDACNLLRFCRVTSADNPVETLSALALACTKSQLLASGAVTYTPLIPQCKDVAFAFYPVAPPLARATCLKVSFTLTENGVDHRYEIVAALRGHAANLLNPTSDAIVATDDD